MKTVQVALGEKSYPIHISADGWSNLSDSLSCGRTFRKVFVISDENVLPLYQHDVLSAFETLGCEVFSHAVPAGENSKSLSVFETLVTKALRLGLDRHSAIVALGGGVIGDLAGFLASTYMRGIAFIQIPTSLLAQVDSSVGGKVAVNHALGKNMIGVFYQPELVYINVQTLLSLPKREFSSGMAELIKHAFIWDTDFLNYLKNGIGSIMALDFDELEYSIYISCGIKARIVEQDEKETSLRAILNFGHTIGHALETSAGYSTYTHGEAVAIGMVYESYLAREMGLVDNSFIESLISLLERTGLPTAIVEVDTEKLISSMHYDKKNKDGKIVFVLPTDYGKVQVFRDVDINLVKQVLTVKKWM